MEERLDAAETQLTDYELTKLKFTTVERMNNKEFIEKQELITELIQRVDALDEAKDWARFSIGECKKDLRVFMDETTKQQRETAKD